MSIILSKIITELSCHKLLNLHHIPFNFNYRHKISQFLLLRQLLHTCYRRTKSLSMLRCIQLFHSPNHIIQAEVYRNIFEVKNIKSNTTDQNLSFHISKILVTEYSHVLLLCKINYVVNCLETVDYQKTGCSLRNQLLLTRIIVIY